MSKFCNNCGSIMDDDVMFCPTCGAANAPAAEAPAAEVPAENPVDTYAEIPAEESATPADNKKNLITLLAGVAAVAVVVILAILLFGSSYKDAVNNLEGVLNGKANKIESLAPKAYWTYLEEEEEVELKELKKDFKENYEDAKEELEEEYGKNAKFNIKITDKKKLSKKKVGKIAEAIEDSYDIDEKKVKAAYELEVEMTIKGREDEEEQEMELVSVKIGGKWYPVMVMEYEDEVAVMFMTGMIEMIM